MLGFNAVRVAFAFDNKWGINGPITDWTQTCEVPSETVIKQTLVPGPSALTKRPASPDVLPPMDPPEVRGGVCNTGWPQDSTYKRFLWVIDYFVSQVN